MKLPQLTFTRFIAAMAIAIFHGKETTYPFTVDSIDNFVRYFNVFVSYFFVLSGFILVISGSDKLSYKNFYINRFARIYPLYLFALVITLILIFNARTPKDTIIFSKVFLSATLLHTWFKDYALIYNFPSWSLSVEAFFYLIFPGVIFIFRNVSLKKEIIIIGIVWLIMQILFVLVYSHGNYFIIYHPIFHTSTFLVGITAGKLFRAHQPYFKMHLKKLFNLLVFFGLAIIVLILYRNTFFQQYYPNGLLAPVFLLFIFVVALSDHPIFVFFKNRVCQYAGEISYGIYILQIPVAILVFGIVDRTLRLPLTITFYIYLIILMIVSAITYEWIEKPGKIFIRNRLAKK